MIETVLCAAVGYDRGQVRPFFRSLRDSGFEGHVLAYADGGGALEAADCGADVLPCPPVVGVPHAARFRWMLDAMPLTGAGGVLLADVRDVVFQRSPAELPDERLHVYEEDRCQTLGSCPYNSEWLRLGYHDAGLAKLAGRPILCVGTTCGSRAAVASYLERLCTELARIQPRTSKPQDQAAHNWLAYGALAPTTSVWQNEQGHVYTVGYIPRETVRVLGGAIVNASGEVPHVVHQWDRHQNLTALVAQRWGAK